MNIDIPRKINGVPTIIPLIYGSKVGISSEPWMSGVLREILPLKNGIFLDIGANFRTPDM